MKNCKVFLQLGAWSVLILLLIPPLWYSLRTPFALIDDYGNWYVLQSFSQVSGVISWCSHTLFHSQDRFRITFDMYNLVTWGLLGENSALHHAMRWALKAVVVWSAFKIIRLVAPSGGSAIGLSFWVFCVVYIFFPNNPEARLAPQEILTVTFLALLLYEFGRLCVHMSGDLTMLSGKRYLWLLFIFTAMLWAKETNIVMGMFMLMTLVCLNLRRGMHLFPFAVIVLISGMRVWGESHASGYGTAPITWHLIHKNIEFYRKCLFLAKTSLVCTLLLATPSLMGLVWLVIQTRKSWSIENGGWRTIVLWLRTHPILIFYWFVFLSMFVFYATILAGWTAVIRYFYPLVYLLALWIGLTLLAFDSFLSGWRPAVTTFVMIASVYFIGANYYNFVYQFACQYYTRIVEQDVLRTTDRLLKDGRSVTLTINSEFEDKIRDYFNDYLPYYKNTSYRITVGSPPHGDGSYYITQQTPLAGLSRYRQFNYSHVSKILYWCERISSWFQFGRPALIWMDAGASPIGRYGEKIRIWYLRLPKYTSTNN